MKLKYNSPVVLTFSFISISVLILDTITGHLIIPKYFTLRPELELFSIFFYFRLFSYIIGHADWAHLIGNFSFILLIGPILEEKYGSIRLVSMIIITTLITAILNIFLFTNGILGASGIVFMMIILSSMTNIQKGEIPITFILVIMLYLGKEVIDSFTNDNISQFSHIIGGICGGLLGLFSQKNSPLSNNSSLSERSL